MFQLFRGQHPPDYGSYGRPKHVVVYKKKTAVLDLYGCVWSDN